MTKGYIESLRAAAGHIPDADAVIVRGVTARASTFKEGERQRRAGAVEQRRRCGCTMRADGTVVFRVWAPSTRKVELLIQSDSGPATYEMEVDSEGFHQRVLDSVSEGANYFFRLDGGRERPDPASLFQPEGVDGPSAVFLPGKFEWTDTEWRGVAKDELVFYEIHVGTFTPEGTFAAIIPRLAELKELGVTAIELMPVAQFPGGRNWGYDGVFPYAAQNSYGGPRGLQQLVDEAHRSGLAVILDVVYNHFGPEGCALQEFGPYFTDRYRTPWGDAINYDGPGSGGVRKFVIDNARMWLDEFHLDGLRLDATHAIFDNGPTHILKAIGDAAAEISYRTGCPRHVIAESEHREPRLVRRGENGHGLTAQWADDFHHAIHSFLTGERQGYYSRFGSIDDVNEILVRPFLRSPASGTGAEPISEDFPGSCYVVCIQNHDQVGNRAGGDRLGTLVTPEKRRLAASMLLLSSHLPLIFMGEEYGETNPFPYFCSFADPQLVKQVREGRTREFASFDWQDPVPDPQGESTFLSAVLSWRWDSRVREGMRQLYRDLLRARREWKAMLDFADRASKLTGENRSVIDYRRGKGAMVVYLNLGEEAVPMPSPENDGFVLLFRSESERYGGSTGDGLGPYECVVFGPKEWTAFVD